MSSDDRKVPPKGSLKVPPSGVIPPSFVKAPPAAPDALPEGTVPTPGGKGAPLTIDASAPVATSVPNVKGPPATIGALPPSTAPLPIAKTAATIAQPPSTVAPPLTPAVTLTAVGPSSGAVPPLVASAPTPTWTGDDYLPGLDPAFPLVLLPVRIETVFQGSDLLIRVYPDEIFADSHEPELTDAERVAARRYWEHRLGGHGQDAWLELVERFSAPRATWIVRQTEADRQATRGAPKRYAWTRAVIARLLPSHWVFHLSHAGPTPIVRRGGPISPTLALTVTPPPEPPRTEGASGEGDGAPYVDEAVRWTTDFATAERAGMAIRIPVGSITHFERVLVFGIRASSSPQDASMRFAELLEAHRYTRGLAIVPQGTPTNNSERGPAGATEVVPEGPPGTPSPSSANESPNDRVLSAALGVAPTAFANLPGSQLREQDNATAMNTALWPATLGYFLAQRAEPLVSVPLWDRAREHFARYVRGRGPFPCFRVGAVPYGVLPVSSLARWAPRSDDPLGKPLAELLQRAYPLWRQAVVGVPRVGRTGSGDADLLEVLGLDASAREVRVRHGLGPQALANFGALQGMPAEVALLWCATRLRNIHPIARALGLSDAFAATVYADEAPRIADPLVTAAALSEVQTLAPNYLTELRDASLEDLRRGPLATRTQAPLLFRLVRHGLLLEFLRLNLELSHGGGDAPNVTQRTTARLREPEIVPDYGTGVSLWDSVGYFQQYLTDLRLAPTVRPPEDPTPNATRYLQDQLRPLRHAVERLAACPSAELERLLTETLDTCSHRLDAWITSLYTERLEQMRDAQAQGCHLGAYAYVENLRRRTTDPVSDGYIHAPSLDHAAAAAVLRNAFSSHREAAGRFAFDLSSARVQKAQSILDPVRAGQSLSEVLGYRVERWLHEADLDRCIHPLRQRYPLVANKRGDSGLRPEEVAARSVVDGLALHRDPPAPGPGSPFEGVDPTSVRDLLHELAVSVDAVEDLLTAEGVYQLVRGGASVASATLDTLTRGTRPPDPDILRSPRSGIAITHRVMLVLGPATGETSVWGPRRDASARAQLDPSLDDYVGETLGDPSRVSCSVRWKPAPGTAVAGVNDAPGVVEVTLQNLELLPLDVLALVDEAAADWHLDVPPGAPPGTPLEGPADELNRRIVAYVVRAIRDAVVLDITHTTLTAGNRSFPQLWEVARTLRDALRHGQPLTPEDLAMPGPSAGSALAPAYGTETAARVAAAAGLMATCGRGLLGEELRASLELAAKFGVPGAFPQPAWLAAGTAEALRARANEVLREVVSRLAKAAAVATPSIVGAVAITDLRDAAIARSAGAPEEVAKALFGAAPVMLRTFAPRDVEGVRTRFSQGRSLGASPAAVRRWFTQAARVREPLHRLRKLSMYCATTPPVSGPRAPRALSFTVAQMSPAPYDRWVALPFGDRAPPLPGTLSIAALLPENMPTTVWSGVRFDEWVELIPNAREVTGIAFHHDDPGAEAAQAILVAVPPVEGVPWDMPTLVDALDETFALAKVRAVDAERLAHVGALVPAIHLADNTHNDTVTTRFTGRLVGDAPATGGGGAAT